MEEVAGLLLFLHLGLTTPALAARNGFHFVDQAKTWTEAQSYCRDKFKDLATIHTQDDWTTVMKIIAKSGHPFVWLGLYDDVKSWRWSMNNTSLYSRDLGTWFPFTEDNDMGDEHCADIWNGQVHDYSCGSELRLVCYHEPSNSFIQIGSLMSWQWAQSYCREHYTDLASIRDQQELYTISNLTELDKSYWIGLSREAWQWSDRSHSSFRRWASGQPSEHGHDCGAAGADGWYDHPCGHSYPFICSGEILHVEAPHRKVLKVTLKTAGSVNLNDPLVQEAILKQMEKDLIGQGVTQEFRLSWRKQLRGGVFNKTEL